MCQLFSSNIFDIKVPSAKVSNLSEADGMYNITNACGTQLFDGLGIFGYKLNLKRFVPHFIYNGKIKFKNIKKIALITHVVKQTILLYR